MGQGTICLLVVAFVGVLHAAEIGLDNLPQSEVKEIEEEIAKGNVPPDYTPSDKAKRGVAKLSNADAPTFNHLSSSSATSTASVKTSSSSSQTPYRYVYNNQYYQSNPFISYIQSPQAAQIASQYAFQPSIHYLHTPTQIQYVSAPSPASRYQTVSGKVAGTTGTSATASTAYQTQSQQVYIPQQSLYQAQNSGAAHQATTGSANQYTAPQQLYYQQQPIVMLLVQQQPNSGALLYPVHQQQHQTAYVLGQQPFYNVFGGHRFSLPYTTLPNNQVTYLVPMAIQSTASVQSSSGVKSSAEKTSSGIQTSTSAVSYGVRTTKA